MKYYFGVYRDYHKDRKIAQLCLSVDDLSCEILADPGCVVLHEASRDKAVSKSRVLALANDCSTLELNFEKFKVIKTKKR